MCIRDRQNTKLNSRSDSNEEKFETKFDKLNKRFDIHDHKLDEIKSNINKMKLQNSNIDKHINDIDERCNVIFEQVITVNDNLKSFASNSGNMTTDSREINNKVSNTNDYNNVLKSDTVDNSSNIESRKSVDVSNEVVVLSLIHI